MSICACVGPGPDGFCPCGTSFNPLDPMFILPPAVGEVGVSITSLSKEPTKDEEIERLRNLLRQTASCLIFLNAYKGIKLPELNDSNYDPDKILVSAYKELTTIPGLVTIVASAVKTDKKVWSLLAPNRHHHVLRLIADSNESRNFETEVEGFLDSNGKFLTRKEAMIIALEAGQVLNHDNLKEELFSEDVW